MPAGEQLGHDLGVHPGAAGGDAAQGVDELVDAGHAVLEQVAHAAAAVGEQLAGVGLLDVLGEHQHPAARAAARGPAAPPAHPRRGTSAAAARRPPRRRADRR
ncbi:hypothetical protein N599_08175 [Saccharopolyspora erythraea D]|nr:hypothetical protein N599_08175 [Saccharopolyspora erythraea D]